VHRLKLEKLIGVIGPLVEVPTLIFMNLRFSATTPHCDELSLDIACKNAGYDTFRVLYAIRNRATMQSALGAIT
tara:strand:- start:3394 stop:3615 length:222 start_codon:yes stop_codon:yes gene_type:complete